MLMNPIFIGLWFLKVRYIRVFFYFILETPAVPTGPAPTQKPPTTRPPGKGQVKMYVSRVEELWAANTSVYFSPKFR